MVPLDFGFSPHPPHRVLVKIHPSMEKRIIERGK
jgi:hypothetical protein